MVKMQLKIQFHRIMSMSYLPVEKAEGPYTLRFLSFNLQSPTATAMLKNIATIAGAITAVGFTLPYCCL